MSTETSHQTSYSEAEFCPDCGTVLDLSRVHNVNDGLTCDACQKVVDVNRFIGIVSKTRIVFNSKQEAKKAFDALKNKDKSGEEVEGCVVDKECKFCGHDKMSYATLQTRSADEGQTVFYTCLKCSGKFTENS